MTRNAYTTFEKFVTLMNPALEVTNPGDGTLAIATPWGRMSVVEESPLYFRQVDGRFHFAFREDAQGRVAYMFTDLTPQFAFQKAAWYGAPGFNTALLLACLLLFVSVLPVAAVRAASPRKKGVVSWCSFSGATPAPWSRTVTIAQEPARTQLTLTSATPV